MVTLHETEVDGVRCFWVETGRPTLAAQLMFRQGIADEPLRESGWLHLLEHLALHGRDKGPLQINGSISLLTTSFDAHGPHELVSAHFSGLTRWLAAPAFDELDRERTVLRAEAEMRGGPVARALSWRYGARGPGVAAYLEPALGAATPDLLGHRAATVFTRGNAVLALDGPPPPDLRLDLPEGQLLPAREAVPCEETPEAYIEGAGLVVSGVVSRSASATLVPDLLQRALTDRLRHQDGGSYAPWATYEPVDDQQALLVAGSDVLPESRAILVSSMLGLLERMAKQGAHGTHLTDAIQARRQVMHDPYAAYGVAAKAANAVLNGRTPMTFQELVAELDTTSVPEVQQALADFHASLLLGIPGDATWDDQLPMLTTPSGDPRLEGRRFRGISWPAVKEELVVGPAGLELRAGGQAQTIDFNELEGVVAFEDGGRHLIRRDGYGISVEPGLWREGSTVVQTIDSVVPTDTLLPQPRRNPPPEFPAPGWLRRWGLHLRNQVARPRIVIASRVIAALAVLCPLEAGLIYLATLHFQGQNEELFERFPPSLIGLLTSAGGVLIILVIVAGIMALRDPYPEE